MGKIKLVLGAAVVLFCSVGIAGTVEHRSFEEDPTGLVCIEDTGYEWLNFGFTYGKSYQQSVDQYDDFGFRPATIDEISAMFLSLGVDSRVQTECS